MNNSNKSHRKIRQLIQQTHTPLPHWQRPSISGLPVITTRKRKWYMAIAIWSVVIGVALGAGLNRGRCSLPEGWRKGQVFALPEPVDSLAQDSLKDSVCVLCQVENSLPKSFRNTKPNEILEAENLRPVAEILAKGERPLRVLHIGDSHVAGKIFPNTLKATLFQYLGEADNPSSGTGIWFNFIAKNGATNQTLITDDYMNRFALKHPDLIILSLGTNEAHGMGYREAQHQKELLHFLDKLKSNCPDAVILMTTPPGDYLSYSYVDYRKTARSNTKVRQVHRSKKPNPMSARCAALIVQVGHDNRIPVWDLYTICGGNETAQRNWVAGHFMRPDRIHFLPVGYIVHGKMLGEALVHSLTPFKF